MLQCPRVKHASFFTPWPVPSLCLESLSEMVLSFYSAACREDLEEDLGRENHVSLEPPSGSRDRLDEMPARAGLYQLC